MSQLVKGFVPKGEFFDDENFPKGFSKSGEFTISEVRLLEDYGQQLDELSSGQLTATTSEQQHFLKVVSGQASPASPLEKVWLKYMQKVEQGMVAVSAFGSSAIDVDEEDIIDEPLDDLDD